jgi:hypothetical protein
VPERSRLRTFVAPWAEIAYLKRELHGARRSGSAEAKRVNRLATRIGVLDRKIEKLHAQARHDQVYIDALESRLGRDLVGAARSEIPDRLEAEAAR